MWRFWLAMLSTHHINNPTPPSAGYGNRLHEAFFDRFFKQDADERAGNCTDYQSQKSLRFRKVRRRS